jgi:nucleoside-diphosphate-sugar epimerase
LKVLVTGGSGFIGSSLANYLLKNNYDVIIFDNLSNSSKEKITSLTNKGAKFVEGDILNYNLLSSSLVDVDFVIHLAAKISVSESILNPSQTFEINVNGTINVLNACVENHIHNIIVASSAAVYGESTTLPISEQSQINPISPYGESKIMMEKELEKFTKIHNLNSIILRFFNIYGKGQTEDYAGVIVKFLESISENKSLIIYGDGSFTRDFISLEDVIDSIHNAMLHIEKKHANIYNIGTGKFVSIKELANIMYKISGKSLPIEFRTARKGDIRHSQTLIDLARLELGFSPKITLEEGLKKLFNPI